MFDWITKPQIMWTPLDSLLCIIELVVAIWLLMKIAILICKVIDYFNRRK